MPAGSAPWARGRAVAAPALAALAAVLLAYGGALLYVKQEIGRERPFAARLVSSLHQPAVRGVVAERSVDALLAGSGGDLLAVRPLMLAAVDALIVSPSFKRVALFGIEDAHRSLVQGDGSVLVRGERTAQVLVSGLRSVSPAVARRTSGDPEPVLGRVDRDRAVLQIVRSLVDRSASAWLVLGLALAAALAALAVSRDRRATVMHLGAGMVGAGLLVGGAVWLGGRVVTGYAARATGLAGDRERQAADAVWQALFADARNAALTVAAGGLLVAAVAAVARRARTARRPGAARLVLATGCAAITAAAFVGAGAIALEVPSLPAGVPAPREGCNGSRALCDRRLSEVVWPATHNSYAASDQPRWFFANQRRGIARQLDDGITALLIDVHWGVRDPKSGRVRTDLRAEGSDRNKVVQQLHPRAVRIAERLAGRIGRGLEGRRALYLCHTLCELGAEPLDGELAAIRGFLDHHADDVLLLVVEDYVPPARIREALQRAGLLGYAAELDRARPLPTLGRLGREGRRLVIFAEKQGGAYPWYMPAFSFIEDTPLGNRRPQDFTCRRFRGGADSPILLLNHWIDRFPPRVSDNARATRAGFLRGRIEQCMRERGISGAVVAVDFYERGAVLDVARELNR